MPTKLEPETRYEQGGKEKFPHIYGPINKDAVNRTIEVRCNDDGLFQGVFDDVYIVARINMHTMEKHNVVRRRCRVMAGLGMADCGALR